MRIPHVGDASKASPDNLKWELQVFGCNERTAYPKEQGALVATLPVEGKPDETVHVR